MSIISDMVFLDMLQRPMLIDAGNHTLLHLDVWEPWMLAHSSGRASYSSSEWRDRCHVALLCRLLALHRMSDAANQNVAVRSADDPDHYITHRLGMFFEEAKASDLIRVTSDGRDYHTGKALELGKVGSLNAGAPNICLGAFKGRPDINVFIHAHAKPVFVVSMMQSGLLPLSQPALYLIPRTGYWPYIFDEDAGFQQEFGKALRDKDIIARNHGFYTVGTTPGEAFFRTFYLAQACDLQIAALASNAALHPFSDDEVRESAALMQASDEYHYDGSVEWGGWVRMVDRASPGYDQ